MSPDGGRSAVIDPTAARPRALPGLGWLPLTLAAAAAGAWLYYPVLAALAGTWHNDSYHSYGVLVAPWSAWLAFTVRGRVAAAPFRRDVAGLAVAAAGLAMLALADALDSLTLAALSIPLVLGGVGRFALGREAFRPLVFPVAFLAFMAPLPASVVPALVGLLQHLAAGFSASVLGLLGIPFWREDVLIHLRPATVQISEACSGLRFLLAMAVLGTAFAWASGAGRVTRLLVIGVALGAAMAGNLARVAGTTVLVHFWGPDASLGLFHNSFGKAVYLAVFVLFFLFVFRLRRRPDDERRASTPVPRERATIME